MQKKGDEISSPVQEKNLKGKKAKILRGNRKCKEKELQ